MTIPDAEIARVKTFPPGTQPNYNLSNPIWKLIRVLARLQTPAHDR